MARHRPSMGTALGALALVVALGGTAAAATGTVVNIADGTTASYVAKVDAGGALKVRAEPVPAARPYQTRATVAPEAYGPVTALSTATVAVDRIVVANLPLHQNRTRAVLYSITVPAGSPCSLSSAYADLRVVGDWALAPSATVVDTSPSGLVLKPNGTRPWCLIGANFPEPYPSSAYVSVALSGWVVAGTPPPGTAHGTGADASEPTVEPVRR